MARKKEHGFPAFQRGGVMVCFGVGPKARFLNRLNAGANILRSKFCRVTVATAMCRGNAGRLLLALFCLLAAAARAADPGLSLAAPSTWISPLPFQRLTRPEDTNSGPGSRLLLRDVQINARARETFQHEARQLLSRAGVQSGSQLAIDFDATRQSLVLHWVRIWRGNIVFNELNLDKVKVIQPERDVERYLFTGEKTALLLLEDVRVGDIVEYACTLRGENAGGGGKSSGVALVRMYEPVERLATRLVWPLDRHLYLKNHGTDTKPAVVKKEDLTEFDLGLQESAGSAARGPVAGRVRPAALGAMERVPKMVRGQPVGADHLHQRPARCRRT